MSLHASNVGTGSLEGTSRGSHTRWGFEYTVPITLRRYAPRRAPRGVVADADSRRTGNDASRAARGDTPPGHGETHRPDTVIVAIRQFKYERDTIEVKVGDVVVWRNADQLEHTVTADSSAFESPLIKPGKEWSYRFTVPGRFAYHCMPHPFMKAVVLVQEVKP
jgi:plastocyanin